MALGGRWALALGLAGALAASPTATAGALSGGRATSAAGVAPPSAAGQPASSGPSTLMVGTAAYPASFDPTSSAAPGVSEVFDGNVFEHLVQLAPDGTIDPMLASRYTVSADRRRYVFVLRPGVRFSNGDRLTAGDVVFSLDRAMQASSANPSATLLTGVRSVRALSRGRVAVTLKTVDWQFLYDLASTSAGIVVDPTTVATLATHPVGTGPFVLRAASPGVSVTLARNQRYWGRRPKLARVVFHVFVTADAENTALLSGDIDLIDNEQTLATVPSFKANPSLQVKTSSTAGKVQLTINNAAGPLSLVAVRQAISYAVDRNAIDKTAAAGAAVKLGTDAVPGEPYYLNLAQQYAYSPAKAKQLLAAAGYPGGFATTLVLPSYPFAQLAGPLIAAELGQVGIKVSVTTVDPAAWASQVVQGGNFGLTVALEPQARDQANYANPAYYWHYAGSDEVKALLDAGDSAQTAQEWVADYQQALHLITDEAVNDWLYVQPQVLVAQATVTGLTAPGLGDFLPLAGLGLS